MEHTTFLPRSTSDLETGERRAPDCSASSLVADAASQLSHWDRLALASGAVFVVVILALLPLAPMPPGADASPVQISDWYQRHRSAVLMQASLRGLAGLLQLIFMAGIASVVARTQGRTGVLTLLAFGGALGGTLIVLLSNAVIATTSLVVDSGTEAGVVRSLDTLTRMLTTFDDPPWALGYAAASLALLQVRAVPAWLGGLGLVAATLLLIHAATGPCVVAPNPVPLMVGLLGFALSLVWLLATSGVFMWRSRAQRPSSRGNLGGVY